MSKSEFEVVYALNSQHIPSSSYFLFGQIGTSFSIVLAKEKKAMKLDHSWGKEKNAF
jgi:hypothetical protein